MTIVVFVTRIRRWLATGCLLFFALAFAQAYGAQRADWWIYVANDDAEAVRDLLARGADPNARNKKGQPALMQAVADGAWKVFDVLASDPRTNLNIDNPAGETPLMYLAISGQTERVRQLIARGAEVNRLGWTPLHYAASKGRLATAKLLLAHRAMVNAPAPDGTTPLMMAAYSGKREMVQLLLQAGADPTTRNLKGQHAADWALGVKAGGLAKELELLSAKREHEREAMRGHRQPAPAASRPRAKPVPESAVSDAPAGLQPVLGVSNVQTDPNNFSAND